MNENKKMLIIGLLVLGVIITIPVVSMLNNKRSEKILNEVNEYIEDEDYKVVYIGRDDCYYCTLFTPEIENVANETDFDYLYVNTNHLTNDDLDKLLENLEIKAEDFGTPYLVITKDGKIINQTSGYISEDVLFDYLKERGVLDEDEQLSLNYIDYKEYENLINSKEKQVIVLGQSGCSACTSAKPHLYEIAKEYEVTINYINISNLDEESSELFRSSLTYYEENNISTPTMLVVSEKKVIDVLVGSADLDTYVEFLENNGFIEE